MGHFPLFSAGERRHLASFSGPDSSHRSVPFEINLSALVHELFFSLLDDLPGFFFPLDLKKSPFLPVVGLVLFWRNQLSPPSFFRSRRGRPPLKRSILPAYAGSLRCLVGLGSEFVFFSGLVYE